MVRHFKTASLTAFFLLSNSLTDLVLAQDKAGEAVASGDLFRFDRINALIFVVLFSTTVLLYTRWAKQGKDLFLRKIPGLNAIEEAVGRATEMGRPVFHASCNH